MDTIKLNNEIFTLLHISTIISIGIVIVYQYNKLYNNYNKLKLELEEYQQSDKSTEQYLIIKYTKQELENNINANIPDTLWKELCVDDSIDDYICMWVKDTYDVYESDTDDSDSDYIPSESGTDSGSESGTDSGTNNDSESDLSESEVTELKITKSIQKDIKVE